MRQWLEKEIETGLIYLRWEKILQVSGNDLAEKKNGSNFGCTNTSTQAWVSVSLHLEQDVQLLSWNLCVMCDKSDLNMGDVEKGKKIFV